MAEIQEISLGRMNNGAHYMYVADILARAEEHASLSTKLSKQMTALYEDIILFLLLNL